MPTPSAPTIRLIREKSRPAADSGYHHTHNDDRVVGQPGDGSGDAARQIQMRQNVRFEDKAQELRNLEGQPDHDDEDQNVPGND